MNLLDRIEKNFSESIAIQQNAVAVLQNHIALAAQMLTHCLLAGGKILSCGNGSTLCDAEHFSALMLHRFETERPGLPAIALTASTTLNAIAHDGLLDQVFAKQLQTLGHTGDILLVLSAGGPGSSLLQAIDAAHQRDMHVILLSSQDDLELAQALQPEDIEIRIPSQATPRIQEMHRFIIHCLCDLIDHQLMGG